MDCCRSLCCDRTYRGVLFGVSAGRSFANRLRGKGPALCVLPAPACAARVPLPGWSLAAVCLAPLRGGNVMASAYSHHARGILMRIRTALAATALAAATLLGAVSSRNASAVAHRHP